MAADMPDPAKETVKCRELLVSFTDESDEKKYILQLVSLIIGSPIALLMNVCS